MEHLFLSPSLNRSKEDLESDSELESEDELRLLLLFSSAGKKIFDSLDAISYHSQNKKYDNGSALELLCEIAKK